MPALPVSMSLGLLALIFAVAIGLVFGIRAGLKPNSAADHASMGLAMIGISLPNFVIGAILLIVFALWLDWLPVNEEGKLVLDNSSGTAVDAADTTFRIVEGELESTGPDALGGATSRSSLVGQSCSSEYLV